MHCHAGHHRKHPGPMCDRPAVWRTGKTTWTWCEEHAPSERFRAMGLVTLI